MAKTRQILFRIFYSTSFTIVFILTFILISVTPADAIYESYQRRRLLDIFILAGSYVLTGLIASLIYASRLYTNRSVLRDIPKAFMPIEKEDLPGRRVHRLIEECLEKSAVVAYQARPRAQVVHEAPDALSRIHSLSHTHSNTSQENPTWGPVSHCGWSSPASPTLPNLEYTSVVDELASLIEAKAMSLAPPDELSTPGPDGTRLPDPRVIDALARPEHLSLRTYLTHLIDLAVVPAGPVAARFLTVYERARFSPAPLEHDEFDELMRLFAELLRLMAPVDVTLVALDADSASASASESASLTPSSQHLPSASSHGGDGDVRGDDSSSSSSGSIVHHIHQENLPGSPSTFSGSVRQRAHPPRRVSEDSVPSLSYSERNSQSAAPAAADGGDDDDGYAEDDEASAKTPASRVRSRRSAPSLASSGSGSASGSVIRLARPDEADDPQGLPYRIEVPRGRQGSRL